MRSFRTYCHVGYLSFELPPCVKKGVATIISFRLVTVIGSGYITNLDKIGPIKVIIVPWPNFLDCRWANISPWCIVTSPIHQIKVKPIHRSLRVLLWWSYLELLIISFHGNFPWSIFRIEIKCLFITRSLLTEWYGSHKQHIKLQSGYRTNKNCFTNQ